MANPQFRRGHGWRTAGIGREREEWYPVYLVDDETGREWHVADAVDVEFIDRLVAFLNESDFLADVETWNHLTEKVLGKPRETFRHFHGRLEEWVFQHAHYRDAWEHEGFTWTHTGGGCTAWERILEREGKPDLQALVAGEGASVPEKEDECFSMGLYEVDEEGCPTDDSELCKTFPNTIEGILEAVCWAENTADPSLGAVPCTACESVYSVRNGCDCQGVVE